MELIHIDISPTFKKGDPPPADKNAYTHWHEWADVQHKSGLRQGFCPTCCKWFFPQEDCGHDKSERETIRQFNKTTREAQKLADQMELSRAKQIVDKHTKKPTRSRP
jgi:microsomal dipeptidase-like Zn-dependent dipeptidase